MFFFIVGLILLLVAVGRRDYRTRAAVVAAEAGVLGILGTLLPCFAQVGTQEIGIVRSFGKVTGDLGAGLHAKAPWATVTEMDGTIQTDSYTGDGCLTVRIARQQTSCVNVSIHWRIEPSAADELFRNYRDFANVRASLVTR